jgi:hypothetical protein
VACVFGYMLSLGGGYDPETLSDHKWQGIGVALFAWVAWAVKYERIGSRLRIGQLLYVPVLSLAVLLLLSAGHHGGSLTHGSDYLTQYTPEPFRSLAGIPPHAAAVAATPITDVNEALVYAQIVDPILQSRCVQCRNVEKSKGDLRMDTPDYLKKGGEEGPIFVTGKGADSKMVKYCLLDESEEMHMPPKGKPQLTPEQITILTWWIDQGATFDKKVADLQVTETVKPALAALGGGTLNATGGEGVAATPAKPIGPAVGPAPLSPVLTMNVPAADPKVVDELKKTGLLVLPLSKENNQLEISAVNVKTLADAQELLKTVYVWQTKTTEAGIAKLKQALPNVEVIGGMMENTVVRSMRRYGASTSLELVIICSCAPAA